MNTALTAMGHEHCRNMEARLREILTEARAAIAKATGQTK